MPHSVIAFFCDDIRAEASGQHTIIGLLPDNIAVPRVPITIPKLAIFTRVQLDAAKPPTQIQVSLKNCSGTDMPAMPQWDTEVIAKGLAGAKEHQSPIFGLIGTVIIAPFVINALGHITCSVSIDGEVYVAGILNVILDERPNASSRPSQSAPDTPATS